MNSQLPEKIKNEETELLNLNYSWNRFSAKTMP